MKKFIYLLLVSFLVLISCSFNENDNIQSNNNSMQELQIPDDFEFSLEKKVDLYISIQNYYTVPIPDIIFDISYKSSTNEYLHIMKAMTNEQGIIEKQLIVPSYVEKLFISGLMRSQELDIINGTASFEMGPNMAMSNNGRFLPPPVTRSFSYLTGIYYDENGVPDPADYWAISPEIMARINVSLPEREDLNDTHPAFLADDVQTNFVFTEDVEVWVTFVAEGASYKNALGFYTYDVNNAPADPTSLNHTIVYPNCSYTDSGGGLDPGIKLYMGSFSAGTVLGWFLVEDGWESYGVVDETAQRFYSDSQYNPEAPAIQQHSILLYDNEDDIFVIGFEDKLRNIADNDFNDAVFIVHAIPSSSVNFDNIADLDDPPDTDGDGVMDPLDEFPEDPDRAFYQYYPSDNYASIVFEDLWPLYGDYDMNDMVVDYRYEMVTDAAGLTIDINILGKLRAAGASNNNGFSIEFPFLFSEENIVEHSDNIAPALESYNYTILDLFSNTTSLTGQSAPAAFNTNMSLGFHEPVDFYCNLTLEDNVDLEALDFPLPFHRFITQNGVNSHEIHMINEIPTPRRNLLLFGTEDDASDPGEGLYYRSSSNLPWALSFPESWHYPAEQYSITEVYNQFAGWAESGGLENDQWFLFDGAHVDMDKVYIEP
ncbi:MAG: LruC domain-containing protein [Candidatus Cloacimonetes bacterium]|nr:LruC domain-containing protein [Candidatus Cloacimonadota bacterium]